MCLILECSAMPSAWNQPSAKRDDDFQGPPPPLNKIKFNEGAPKPTPKLAPKFPPTVI